MENNSSLYYTLEEVNMISVGWLTFQRSAYYIWLLVLLVNLFASIFLLIFLPKWKIFDGDLMYFLRWQLWTENFIIAYSIGLAFWHLYNSLTGRPETLLQTQCRNIVVYHAFLIRMISWIEIWISVDRFIAVVMPQKYLLR